MKASKLLLFILLSLFNHGQASKLAAPSEMLAIYNAYVLGFLKNGATRTLPPGLGNMALVDFGTFVKDTLGEINKYLDTDKYVTKLLLRGGETLPKAHKVMLQQLRDIVISTRGSNAPGFSDAWNIHVAGCKRALAGTQGARLNEMFSVGLKPMFEDEFSGKTLQSSSFPVLDTDVSYDRENWGLTLTANGDPASTIKKYKTWYVGLRNSNVAGAKSYINHQKISYLHNYS
ncbi:hypothetical protein N7494_003148 [Penicillium frequentans]|uniref:Uncharacterized protein n=1 Tax=Penicillium frequentans TaxID=3151616 RepID=A0AAD6GHJ6_9EURO|nr:hypothetical protein N7494_003148 [Penicillium glabrum]